MRAVVVGLLLLSGCDALFNLDHVPSRDGGDGSDGAHGDSSIDGNMRDICIGTGRGFQAPFCFPSTTQFPAVFSPTAPIDTDANCDDVLPQNGTTAVCVKKAMAISIAVSVRVTGTRPLVLLAVDTITISGGLDASSNRIGMKGAGANIGETTNACNVALIVGTPGGLNTGGGGGAGGTFRGAGGAGGTGDMSFGGQARAAENPSLIRGGCYGGNGGSGGGPIGGGTPGAAGGGAIYLAANTTISVGGSIKANGAGGTGGISYYGGAGGGAGGMIVLDAPTVALNGSSVSLTAVGGGGGQGGASNSAGGSGQDGPTATGGTSSGSGGDGGNGNQANASPGSSGTSAGGGGGGGGGGYIAIFSPNPIISASGTYRPQPIMQ